MALDEATKALIEKNRLEALKRLEERKRRLESENISSQPETNKRTGNDWFRRNDSQQNQPASPRSFSLLGRPGNSNNSNTTAAVKRSNPWTQKTKEKLGERTIEKILTGKAKFQLISPTICAVTPTNFLENYCLNIKNTCPTVRKQEGIWNIPIEKYRELIEKLPNEERPSATDFVPKNVLALFDPNMMLQRKAAQERDYNIKGAIGSTLYDALFPFQREGVQMAIARNGRIILADEMGLGKSIQAIAISSYYRREWPLLVLAPASMVASWHEQIMRWIPSVAAHEIEVIYDGKVDELNGLITILSYDLAVKLIDKLEKRKYRVVIADECHALRNPETKRSKMLVPLIKKSDRAIMLSGTPALSRPIELYPQIQAVNPKLFPKLYDYGIRYCAGHQGYFGWDWKGSSNMRELQVVLENCVMIRRLKDQVLSQLPRKIRHQVFLKIPAGKELKLFQMQSREFDNPLDANDEAAIESMQKKAEYMALWTKTAEVKLPAMIEYVGDLLESNHKMLLFAHHQSVLDGFEEHFLTKKINFIRIDGRTPPNERQALCTSFQSDETVRLALLSITAASTGLTLTAATTVIFAELFFNPGVLVQAEDRAHRIGQVDSVNVHYLLAKGTTDDRIWPLILKKLNTLESVGLGKNDFKDMQQRDHDRGQLLMDRFVVPAGRKSPAPAETKKPPVTIIDLEADVVDLT